MTQASTRQPKPPQGTKVVFIALGLALLSVILVNLYIMQLRSRERQQSFTVFLLNRSIKPGDVLRRNDVREVRVPDTQDFREAFSSAIKDGAYINYQDKSFERAANRDELLTSALFTPPAGATETRHPVRGKRFVMLPVNSRLVPGDLRPDTFVDIEAPFASGGKLPMVFTVMEAVRIVAVGNYTGADQASDARRRPIGSFRTITIEVSPEEATSLSLIEKLAIGDFELHLRDPGDVSRPKIPGGGINPRLIEMIQDSLPGWRTEK